MRPHFAIASVDIVFDLQEAHQLITAKLGTEVPLITNRSNGHIGRDAISDEFEEVFYGRKYIEFAARGIMLTVGFLPGMKVNVFSLLNEDPSQETVMINKFITDIWESSTSISRRQSPAAVMIFSIMPCHQKR